MPLALESICLGHFCQSHGCETVPRCFNLHLICIPLISSEVYNLFVNLLGFWILFPVNSLL